MEQWMTPEIVSGIIGLLVGSILGHRLAIYRDSRREFNEFADPLYLWFNRQISVRPGDDALFRRHLGWLARRRFDSAMNDYKKTQGGENIRVYPENVTSRSAGGTTHD
ncbi:MAG: hypothetical protein EXS05_22130 [Planctomycetaceae bacterium]|nr:hypothetical protein [Planctomycetaceae bacterium]